MSTEHDVAPRVLLGVAPAEFGEREVIAAAATVVEAALPRHKAGLAIEHNPHRAMYMTPDEWVGSLDARGPEWQNDDAWRRSVATGEVWVMEWYPDTPIGSQWIAAPTLAELLAFAAGVG